VDRLNQQIKYTYSQNIAFVLEFRYRSPFDWRQVDPSLYNLDVTYSPTELRESLLSDRRYTFLTHVFVRPNPFWECHLEGHFGWGRSHESGYAEWKLELIHWVHPACQLHLQVTKLALYDKIRPSFSFTLNR
jgi:hypothetical protein